MDELADAILTSKMTRVCHVDVVPQPQLPITVCLASVAFHAVVLRPFASARVMEADTLGTLSTRHTAARILRGIKDVLLRLTNMGSIIDFKTAYGLSPSETGRDVKAICDENDLAPRADLEQVGRFIESGTFCASGDIPVIDHERQFEVTIACDSTLYWKAGTLRNHTSEFIVPIIENEICSVDNSLKFNMPASRILGIDGARVRDWLSAMTDIDSLKDWSRKGQSLLWIDMGNSWAHDRMAEIKVEETIELYASLGRRMHRKFEYVVYISAGDKPIPRWGAMSVPHA